MSEHNGSDGVSVLDWPQLGEELRLSPRESQVIGGIFSGRKYAEIALELAISKHTLDTHWRRIKLKLGVKNHTQAIHRIYEVIIQQKIKEATAPPQAPSPDPEPQETPPPAETGPEIVTVTPRRVLLLPPAAYDSCKP